MCMATCPKCGGSEIDRGRVMSAGAITYKSNKHKVLFNSNTRSYCCLSCGYVETYVDEAYRDRIKAEPER